LLLKTPLWRRTPPAIFPVCLGFMGLGIAWRNAAEILPIPHEIGDLMLGFSTAFFLYFLVFYLAKLAARPNVLFEDMTLPPARAGVATLAMSMMLLAAALLPFDISVPQVWWTGVVLQIAATAIVMHAIWKEPPEERSFTPFMYVTFVGPVVGPLAGIPLGYIWESVVLALAAMVPFLIITVGYTLKLMRVRPNQPLRPALAIYLAPVSLFAQCFGLLGVEWAFWLFYYWGWVVALILLGLGPWLTEDGWTPIWGAFTFPIATFANVQVLAISMGATVAGPLGLWAALSVGTPLIFYIVYRSTMAWVTGELSEKSGAAIA